jgi:long-chain acyl-CoA synthetase
LVLFLQKKNCLLFLSRPESAMDKIRQCAVPVLLEESVRRFADRPAIDFLGKRMSYAELGREVERAAAGFARLGVAKGTRVALHLPNTPSYVICYYAILKIGGVVVNLSPLYVERELRHFIQDSGTRIAVTLDLAALYDKIAPLAASGDVDRLIVCSMLDSLPWAKRLGFGLLKRKELADIAWDDRRISFASFVSGAPPAAAAACDPARDLAVLQYTGGTTGMPKAAMLTHGNLTANCAQVRARLDSIKAGEERVMVLLPLFHVFSMTVGMNLGVSQAMEMILLPRFDKQQLRATLRRKKPTLFPGVPTLYASINAAAAQEKWELSSIRYCVSGAAPLPAEIRARFEALSGCALVEGYGLSEASPVVACNPFGAVRDGSVGMPLAETIIEIRALDDPLRLAGAGETGEICIRGPQVMLGYWNRPEETANVFADGALRTGDAGHIDADGYVFITDRIKELIISGGYNVYPRMVEEALYHHPAVEEAVVIGVPDARRGQVPKAFVKLREGESVSEAELLGFLGDLLSPVERPKRVEFRAALPKTAIGKFSKKDLVAEEQRRAAS